MCTHFWLNAYTFLVGQFEGRRQLGRRKYRRRDNSKTGSKKVNERA